MKRFAPFLALLFIWPSFAGAAEVVKVTSGEHDGYTRLVLTVSSEVDWRLDVSQNTAKLIFPLQSFVFDDERVFSKIAKNRLISIGSKRVGAVTEYIMNLACKCEVTAFSYQNEYIVVDISDQTDIFHAGPNKRRTAPVLPIAPNLEAMFQQPLMISWKLPAAPNYFESPHRVNFPPQIGGIELLKFARPHEPDAPPNATQVSASDNVGPFEFVGVKQRPPDSALQEAIDSARASLLHQLTLAADQGLVRLNTPIRVADHAGKAEPENVPAISSFDKEKERPTAPGNDNQIFIQSVYSRDAISVLDGSGLNGRQCPPIENLNIASWGSGEDFAADISNARKHLLREFDKPDPNEKLRLIRTYIRYGFGVEALSHLADVKSESKNHMLLRDLALVMDGRQVRADGPLSKAVGCAGIAGMWSMVGLYPNIEAELGDTESIVKAFASLPSDIRRLIGPRLVLAFLDRGFDKIGRQVADIINRAPGDSGSTLALTVGKLKRIEGNESDGGERYRILFEENSEGATEALIALATFELLQDKPPSTHLLTDLETAAKTWRGSQKGGELRRLEALWLVQTGNAKQAINLLVRELKNDPSNSGSFQRTAEEILSKLSLTTNTNGIFAELVDIYAEYIPEEASADSLRMDIANKLVTSGLPDYALETLRPSLLRGVPGSIILAARANLAAFRPTVALGILDNETSIASTQVRVEAYLALGDFDSALSQLSQFPHDSTVTILPHWFAGDWALAGITNDAAAEISARYNFEYIEQANLVTTSVFDQLNGHKTDPVTLSGVQELLNNTKGVDF